MTQTTGPTGPPIGELLSRLSEQTSRLVRDEMKLARLEMTESVKHAGIGAGLMSAAGIAALFGVGTLVTAAVAALALVLPLWAAALIVAVVLFVAAAVVAMVSKRQVQQATPAVPQTVETVRDDIAEVKGARHGR